MSTIRLSPGYMPKHYPTLTDLLALVLEGAASQSAGGHAEKGWEEQYPLDPGQYQEPFAWDGSVFNELCPDETIGATIDQQNDPHYNLGSNKDAWTPESSYPGSDFETDDTRKDPAAFMSTSLRLPSSTSTRQVDLTLAEDMSACVSPQTQTKGRGPAKSTSRSHRGSASKSLWVNQTDFYQKMACDVCGKSMPGPIKSGKGSGKVPKTSKRQLSVFCHPSEPCWSEGMEIVRADPSIQKEISLLTSNQASTDHIARHVLCPCADCGTIIHYRMQSQDQARHLTRVRKPTAARSMHCSTACMPSRHQR